VLPSFIAIRILVALRLRRFGCLKFKRKYYSKRGEIMNIKKISVFLTIFAILGISACCNKTNSNNPLREFADIKEIPSWIGVGRDGKLNVVSSRNAAPISPCIRQNTNEQYVKRAKDAKPCQTRIEEKNGKTVVFKDGREITPFLDQTVRIVAFEGSICVTKITAGGTQYEKCY
jgi:hypothetical protein